MYYYFKFMYVCMCLPLEVLFLAMHYKIIRLFIEISLGYI